MSYLQQQLVCDSSTLANFKQWGQAVSNFLRSGTFLTVASDTGQVNWSTLAAVPGANQYVYEVYKTNDANTTCYLKIEYGNAALANCPNLRVTICTSTDGAGNPTGYVCGPFNTTNNSYTPPSSTVQYECNFFMVDGALVLQMWRNSPVTNGGTHLIAIERSLDASGNYTTVNNYMTVWALGYNASRQQSLIFGLGTAPLLSVNYGLTSLRGPASSAGVAFNGGIPVDLCSPLAGKWDFNCTVLGCGSETDFAEAVVFTGTVYGSTKSYLPSSFSAVSNRFGPLGSALYCCCIRVG